MNQRLLTAFVTSLPRACLIASISGPEAATAAPDSGEPSFPPCVERASVLPGSKKATVAPRPRMNASPELQSPDQGPHV